MLQFLLEDLSLKDEEKHFVTDKRLIELLAEPKHSMNHSIKSLTCEQVAPPAQQEPDLGKNI